MERAAAMGEGWDRVRSGDRGGGQGWGQAGGYAGHTTHFSTLKMGLIPHVY